jgi:hypothetical protein
MTLVCPLLMRSQPRSNRISKSTTLQQSSTQVDHNQCTLTREWIVYEQLICGLPVHPKTLCVQGFGGEGSHLIDALPVGIYEPHFYSTLTLVDPWLLNNHCHVETNVSMRAQSVGLCLGIILCYITLTYTYHNVNTLSIPHMPS